jgi:hypothetical protein
MMILEPTCSPRDWLLVYLVALPTNQTKLLPCSSTMRALRHGDGVRPPSEVHPDAREHPGPQQFLLVGKLGPHPQRAGFGVHRAVDENELSGIGMLLAVGQDQGERHLLDLLAGLFALFLWPGGIPPR